MPSPTAAAAPLILKGVEYRVSPLTDRDQEEINNWLRSRMIEVARSALTPSMDQDSRDEILGAAMREAAKLDFMAGRGIKELMGPAGICRLLYQSLRREHPGIQPDQAKQLLFTDGKPDKDSCSAFAMVFTELNMPKGRGEPQENGAPKEGSA